MRAKIVRMGNSRGVRIPKVLLDETGLDGEVEISVRQNSLVIRPVAKVRSGWSEAFLAMAASHVDQELSGDVVLDHSFDQEDWEWK